MSYMGQVTIYLPDEVERRFRLQVKRRKTTLSAYIASLGAEQKVDAKGWPEGYADLFGSLKGKLVAPADPPPEAPTLGSALPARYQRVRRVSRRR